MNDEIDRKRGPAQVLGEEHQGTALKLELIERALDYFQNPPEPIASERVETEEAMLKYLTVALERSLVVHFRKEEEALFPILSEYIGKEYGPIEVMFHEHREILTVLRDFKEIVFDSLGKIKLGEGEAIDRLVETGSGVIRLILRHIDKENKILFKVCDVSLSREESETVLKKMEVIGLGRRAHAARRPFI